MKDDVVITVEHVSKKYCRELKRSMLYGMADIGRNIVGLSSRSETLRPGEFLAVDDVSFEVKRGETLGLIGPNGSGKTTLLKMLNGIFWPDKGKITIKGNVGALIAVGAGFHPLLTGRENIYINGAILGMNRREVDRKLDAIVEFTDIGDFLDSPVKHYSSGMYVRLGFAVAVHSEVDILLIDEVLAVGDINFQAKCINKIKELDERGVTKIFVSHNLNSVELICNKVAYLSYGKMRFQGESRAAINEFMKDALKGAGHALDARRYGTREIEVTSVDFLDQAGNAEHCFRRGESFRVRIAYRSAKPIEAPEFSVGLWSQGGVLFSQATTRDHGCPVARVNGAGEIHYTIDSLPLTVGKYWVTIGCWDSTGLVAYDHHERMYELVVEDGLIDNRICERFGLVHIPAKWDVKS